MFGNNVNNFNNKSAFQEVNVNTKIMSFSSDESLVTLTAWNDRKVQISFAPFVTRNADGVRQYERDNNRIGKFVLTADNAIPLVEAIETQIIPALNQGVSNSVAVYTETKNGGKKYLCVDTDGKTVMLTFIDENGAQVYHTFGTREYINKFSHDTKTGENVVVNKSLIEFKNFISTIPAINMSKYHIEKYGKALGAIAQSKNNNGGGFGFGRNNSNNNSGYSAQVVDNGTSGEFIPEF